MTRTGTRDFTAFFCRCLRRGRRSTALLSCRPQPLLPNVEGVLRNAGIFTEPGDVQPARRLAHYKIAPISLPLIADFSRHGPTPRSCPIDEGASLPAAPIMSFHSRLRAR